jgi:class 3 adenylate cyclase
VKVFRNILDRLHQPNLLEPLRKHGIDGSQIAALRTFIDHAADRELYRANPRYWAERLGLDERGALALIVAGAAEGVFDLTWQTTCPVCRYHGRVAQSLGGLVGLHECAQCDHRYESTLDEDAFVTVSVRGEVRRLSPARREDPVFRTVVDARYGPVSALALINTPAFRELLAQQALPEGQSLGVKRLAIFFSDLRSSTAFYHKYGDAAAYRIVCRHFLSVFDAINRHGGAAVKTIGDGIMGVFSEPDAALLGIAEAITALEHLNAEAGLHGDDRLMLKVGLHIGPCLVVTLNGQLDYFGRTVNLAARLSGLAQGHDVILSHAILDDPKTCALAESLGELLPLAARLRGLSDDFELHRLVIAQKE